METDSPYDARKPQTSDDRLGPESPDDVRSRDDVTRRESPDDDDDAASTDTTSEGSELDRLHRHVTELQTSLEQASDDEGTSLQVAQRRPSACLHVSPKLQNFTRCFVLLPPRFLI